MNNSKGCDTMRTNQGVVTPIKCPLCGFLLAKAEPATKVENLLLFCRKCRKQVRVNLNIAREP